MPDRYRRSAFLLLAVFLIGGLAAPVAHRLEHHHQEKHRHGRAAAEFASTLSHRAGADFLVEEQSPADDLPCDFCARLALHAIFGEPLNDEVPLRPMRLSAADAPLSDHSGRLSSIRGPPSA